MSRGESKKVRLEGRKRGVKKTGGSDAFAWWIFLQQTAILTGRQSKQEEITMSLGSSLYHARKKSGLSQENVAEKLGVSRQTISKWETEVSHS